MAARHQDRLQAATDAGLRYVSDEEPGFSRQRCGKGFCYRDWDGETVRDKILRKRFASLAIPPAWTNVWICRYDDGHIQATGRDDAGRKQYIYHPRWREVRDRAKYRRMVAFGKRLPTIRASVKTHLRRRTLTRERVVAAIVRLLETSLARVGNAEYARSNESFGLSTLRKKHVRGHRSSRRSLLLEFTGKGGKHWEVEVTDSSVISVVMECMEIPGHDLFKYLDADGRMQRVTAADVNEYLQAVAGADISAKDFRTWAGTVLTAKALGELERVHPDAAPRRNIVRAVESVAEELGNTPSICRSAYVHPEVINGFENGVLVQDIEAPDLAGLRREEVSVLAFLERRLRRASAGAAR